MFDACPTTFEHLHTYTFKPISRTPYHALMALVKRKNKKEEPRDGDDGAVKKKVKILKRPACMFPFQIGVSTDSSSDIAFKQQKIKTWQPILIPKAVLPTILLIGLIFAPIGALIVWGSSMVTAITLDYTECDVEAPTSGEFGTMPNNKYSCQYYSPSPRWV
jgi:hypothetical protein